MCESITRRTFVRRGSAAAMAAGFRLPRFDELRDAERPHLEIAHRAWEWLHAHRVETDHGITWPADPLDPTSIGTTLYSHAPGVLPFALQLFRVTGDEQVLDDATAAAEDLARRAGEVTDAGLYTGLAGLAFVLEETYRVSGRSEFRTHAQRLAQRLVSEGRRRGEGVAWPTVAGDQVYESNDIISGTAGTGLGLLYLHRRYDDPALLRTATEAGRRLLEQAQPMDHGMRWDMQPGYEREMPNFSHGTAGIAYFLATLHEATGHAPFLDAAIAGAEYLTSIAEVDSDGYVIMHHRPGGEDLFYLSWCHGPVGTNRLFQYLHILTGDETWRRWMEMGARGIMASGIPEQRTPGFWENISQCCGDAGVGESFLSLYRLTGDETYRGFVTRVNDDLLRRATREREGMKWVQSEHRVRPDLLIAQTGFMQGAAGVGTYFLHVDALETAAREPAILFPDDPGIG